MQLGDDNQETLEGLIDSYSLASVLETLETICHDKAEHLRANWQDEGQARLWGSAAAKLLLCNSEIANMNPAIFTRD